jgi:hypothetical protein
MSNFAATLAAVAARGARCDHCGHWTYLPVRPPVTGRRASRHFCRNCLKLAPGLSGTGPVVRQADLSPEETAALAEGMRDRYPRLTEARESTVYSPGGQPVQVDRQTYDIARAVARATYYGREGSPS